VEHHPPFLRPPVRSPALSTAFTQKQFPNNKYKSAPFVCAGFNKDEQAKAKKKTPDANGGIGYKCTPLSSKQTDGPNNASWGSIGAPIQLSQITMQNARCMYASSYDWHLVGSDSRAYNRFGKGKAAMVFWDGSSRVVSRREYDNAIKSPEQHLT